MIRKGDRFYATDKGGYIATRDLTPGDVIRVTDFHAFGGAPEPIAGEILPDELRRALARTPYATA